MAEMKARHADQPVRSCPVRRTHAAGQGWITYQRKRPLPKPECRDSNPVSLHHLGSEPRRTPRLRVPSPGRGRRPRSSSGWSTAVAWKAGR
jgi:hypothetical protein